VRRLWLACATRALLDSDPADDGCPDIFLVNSGRCDFYHPRVARRHALYRNNCNGTFINVTTAAGLAGGASFDMGSD
jgi:hypothetical protein